MRRYFTPCLNTLFLKDIEQEFRFGKWKPIKNAEKRFILYFYRVHTMESSSSSKVRKIPAHPNLNPKKSLTVSQCFKLVGITEEVKANLNRPS